MGGISLMGLSALLGVTGCNSQGIEDTIVNQGLSVDTESPAGQPYNLRFIVEDRVKYMPHVDYDEILKTYAMSSSCSQVTVDFTYKTFDEIVEICQNGTDEADAVIGREDFIKAGVDAGMLEGGRVYTSIREIGIFNYVDMVVVRKKGGSAEMPKTTAKDGEESVDRTVSRMQNIKALKARIAVAGGDEEAGVAANQILYVAGHYTEQSGTGGSLSEDAAEKVVYYDTVEDVAKAVKSGECELGMLFDWQMRKYKGMESIYTPPQEGVVFPKLMGASVVSSANGGVARDYLQHMSTMV